MKRIIFVLFAMAFVTAASAQYHRDYDRDRDYQRRSGVTVMVGTPRYHDGGWERRSRWVNRRYNERAWEIRHNRHLSPWEKRRLLRELNEERAMSYRGGWHARR